MSILLRSTFLSPLSAAITATVDRANASVRVKVFVAISFSAITCCRRRKKGQKESGVSPRLRSTALPRLLHILPTAGFGGLEDRVGDVIGGQPVFEGRAGDVAFLQAG